MEIKPVSGNQREAFNKVSTHPLQTWEWGEFRAQTGNEIIRFGVFDGTRLIEAIQLTVHKIPYTPYKIGTFIKGSVPSQEVLSFLKGYAKKQNILFIKMEPAIPVLIDGKPTKYKRDRLINLLRKNGAVSGKTLFTPTTFWIDLEKSEEELLKSFHSKTRYNIRVAERHGVKIAEDNSDKAFERYITLTRETVERQSFYAHSEKYHRLMWKTLHTDMIKNGKKPIARLITAKYKKQILTTWIIFVWHDFLYYPYGASTDKHKQVMANNLVMWEAIKYGKRLGLKTFDLWGREPGKGFTPFKEGYKPQIVEFLGTWDLVTSPYYNLYQYADKLRWLILRARSRMSATKRKF